MTFNESIATCLSKYFVFKGRASRSEYWWFYLFFTLIWWAADVVDGIYALVMLNEAMLTNRELDAFDRFCIDFGCEGLIIFCVLLIPSIAAGARRLHDTNRSGWWQLLYLTIIGIIPVMILLAQKSAKQENKYDQNDLLDCK